MRDRDKTAEFRGTTHIAAVLDRSGSMQIVETETRNAYNTWLAETKKASKGQDVRYTLRLFDDRHEYPIQDAPIRTASKLDAKTYYARGMTALNDAFGGEILRLKPLVAKQDRCLILVMTDGIENASREINSSRLRDLIGKAEERPNWTIQYIGANQDAFAVGRAMGMRSSARITRSHDAVGTQSAFAAVAANTTSYLRSADNKAQNLSQDDYDLAAAIAGGAHPDDIQRIQKRLQKRDSSSGKWAK